MERRRPSAKKYAESGVNLDSAREITGRIGMLAVRTSRPGSMGRIGGFGGFFDLGELNYSHPVLVSGADGVGTKLKIAVEMNNCRTVGIDAVAMCVNDILTHGAEPLVFLDYIAVDKLDTDKVEALVAGVAEGCLLAGCALVGGETAEMPGIYRKGEFDIAGFAVGVVEKEHIIDGSRIEPGDVVLGFKSSGVHSNGFSLIRKIMRENGLEPERIYPEIDPERSLGEILLTPTAIYVKPVLNLIDNIDVRGMAHITGGGLYENIARVVPDGLRARLNSQNWEVPGIFRFIEKQGKIDKEEMFSVFNMGIGLVTVISREDKDKALKFLEKEGLKAWDIGEIETAEGADTTGKVIIDGEIGLHESKRKESSG